jgi:hypothetical protein
MEDVFLVLDIVVVEPEVYNKMETEMATVLAESKVFDIVPFQ